MSFSGLFDKIGELISGKKKYGATRYNYDYDPSSQEFSLVGQEKIRKGGLIKKKKSGGYVRAADGIAKKGKTRGRIV